MTAPLSKDLVALSGLFVVSGIVHLVRPEVYEPIVPDAIPAKRAVVHVSGVLELLCAAGLLHPRSRRIAGWASAGLLLAVYPANIKMALDVQRSSSTALKVGALARLPMQIPMIRTALRAARG